MRPFFCFFALLLGAAVLFMPASGAAQGVWVTQEAAPVTPFQWKDGFGGAHQLSDHAGQLVLINLWATWCTPCVKEMPTLDKLAKRYEGKGLTVLPISLDTADVSEVATFYNRLGLRHLPLLQDKTGSVVTSFVPSKLPMSYFIDPQGNWIGSVEGFENWISPATLQKIDYLLQAYTPIPPAQPDVLPLVEDVRF